MKRTTVLRLLLVPALAVLAFGSSSAEARSRRGKARPAQKAPAAPTAPPEQHPVEASASEPGTDVTELLLSLDATEGHPGTSVVVTVRLRDSAGRARDAPLRMEADPGVVDSPVRVSVGVYTVRIGVPASLGNRRSLLLFVAAGQAVSSLALPLASGPAAALSVEAPSDLVADGANHALWIGVTDAHGNPAEDPPRVTVTRGSVGEPVLIGAGEWMIDYRPPRTSWPREEVVSVTAGAARASRQLPLAPVPALLTLSPNAGVVVGAGGPSLVLGAKASVRLADLPPSIGLALGVMWWGASDSSTMAAPGGELDLRTRRTWLPLTISAEARQPLGARGTVAVALGGGGALVSSKASLTGQPGISESGWAPVAMAGVELAYRTRLGAPFIELRGGWVGDPGLETIRGGAWPVMFIVGSHFDAY